MSAAEAGASSLASVGRATLLLTGGAVLVQIIGLARQLFLAAEIGIAGSLDAFLIAAALPQALVAVLTGGVAVALVPAYTQLKEHQGSSAGRRMAGTVLVWLGLGGLGLSIILWVFAGDLVTLTAPGLGNSATVDAVRFLRTLAPLTALSSTTAVMQAACQAEQLFPAMTLAGVANPFLTLVLMVYFWDAFGLDALAAGTIIGAVASLVILSLATILQHVFPKPHLISRGLGLRDLARHAAPLTISRAMLQLQQIFDRAIASALVPGGVSALRYGDSIVKVPFGAISPAYQTAIYPTLVRTTLRPSESSLGATTQRLVGFGLVFFVPLAGLTIAVAPMATALLYDRGSFTAGDISLTAEIVAMSAPLIVTWTVQPALVSALNARREGLIMLASGAITTATNVVLDVALGLLLGVPGIALATVLASLLVVNFMGWRLSQLEPTFSPGPIYRKFALATIAAMPSTIIVGLPIWAGVLDALAAAQQIFVLGVVGVAGLISYYAMARRLGLVEAELIVLFGKSTVLRLVKR